MFVMGRETVAAKRPPRIASACWDALPQIAQNSQNLLLGMVSHRLHRCNFRGCSSLCCTNQANSSPPTDCTEFTEASAGDDLPQISQICTEAANFRGCTCLKCTNLATLVYFLLGWCTSCSGKRQSRAETSAPP